MKLSNMLLSALIVATVGVQAQSKEGEVKSDTTKTIKKCEVKKVAKTNKSKSEKKTKKGTKQKYSCPACGMG